jgi:hypothetical protein
VPALRPTHSGTYLITVPTYAMVAHAKGGHSRTTVGSRQVRIQVAIDMEAVAADLGPKAARSKHLKARALHGKVLIQVVR